MAGAKQIGGLAGTFDGSLEARPPLTDEQLAAIPAKRGVFLLASEDDRPILLATGASIRARLRSRLEEPDGEKRRRTADLRTVTRTVHWKLAGGHFEMDWIYLEIARSLWPETYAKLLSWRPAWFVHVRAEEAFPHFVRTRDVFGSPGRYFGPFESGRSAERFIDVLLDAFDLCRDVRCLRRSPRGQRCAYGQMGRCLCPCDGSVSMEAYRRVVAEAGDFAAGRRAQHLRRLREQMEAASAELKFERAAAVKARLDRLAELDGEAYRHVAPAEKFRFLLIQPSGSQRRAAVFLADRGSIVRAKPLDSPLVEKQLAGTVRRMARFAAGGAKRRSDPAGRWRMGLVARALFSSERRGGLVLRWREEMTPADLSAAIESAAEALGLSAAGGAEERSRSEGDPDTASKLSR